MHSKWSEYVYFIQRWFDYTGLSKEDSYGRGWNTPFHPDDKQSARDAWNHATTTGETYEIESRLRSAEGSYRWFLMRGTPMRDDCGKIMRWFGTCTDIDEMKRAEAEFSRLNQDKTVERGVTMTREVVQGTSKLAQAHGAVSLLVVLQFGPEEQPEQALRRRVLDDAGIRYVFVDIDSSWSLPWDRHPNTRAAHAIATATTNELRRRLAVTGSSNIVAGFDR